ncbi:hypothetical protein SGFS_051160 [Streptomyces graminofaciens]|uniref:Uncharacterized protein n=1 Tax=Streptomyces graminofaciens TaxID=68212 RepID=A0ABN5VK75_9ACTN|nr:hypothetical protein [Streptomyces graminofaciens]BBC33822.1 hypothetical protein SGFS_051160 [Streptomyces graminofaciens]
MFDTARDAVGDLVTELSSFTAFQKRVDQLIRDLKDSDAAPGKVSQEQLVRGQFGGGNGEWAEAAGLHTAYETVVTELENLSKLLSDSMEGMAIAVLASHKGYENIDLDIRDRMAAISAETTEHYGGAYDPGLPKQGGTGGDAGGPEQAPSDGGDSGGTI